MHACIFPYLSGRIAYLPNINNNIKNVYVITKRATVSRPRTPIREKKNDFGKSLLPTDNGWKKMTWVTFECVFFFQRIFQF